MIWMKVAIVEIIISAVVLILACLWSDWYTKRSRREYIRVMHPFLYNQLFNNGKDAEKLT